MTRTQRTWIGLAVGLASTLAPTPAVAEGVTLIMHGWNVAAGEPAWTGAMQTAIDTQHLGGAQRFGTITVTGTVGNLTATCSPWNVDLTGSTNGEIVIRVDWSAVANHLVSRVTAQEVAAAIAPKLYQGQNGAPALAELPLHLVGHSRGGGMVLELARLLGRQGIEVDQVSPLDPHPLTATDPQPLPPNPAVIDTPVAVYENVLFVDGYWQGITYPKGQYVNGAYNREWTSLPGGYHNHPNSAYSNIADHLNIVLAYHGTVDLNTPTSNGEATLGTTERSSWFNAYETGGGVAGQRTGFYYSRIAGESDRLSTDTPVGGGDEVRHGYANDPLLGGLGARSAQTWTSAVWPNLSVVGILKNGSPLGPGVHPMAPGTQLAIDLIYRDVDSGSTLTLLFDADRNPYNNNTIATVGSVGLGATGATRAETTAPWDTTPLPEDTTGYLCAKISDGVRTRYLYATPGLRISTQVFADGYESGGLSGWSSSLP